ncbi:TPA: HNH endonuclease [Clostridium botulinum]|uniref:HNH endonuclease domain-containing protein n=1 Tax=Clostridium botulinum TaxID=1491 RepID=UPI0009D21DA6|nr:HNH endonuclease domain-containing protein [Clostridium botulinum]OPD34371.1 HNH endonuclease [Clostridium botulinum]HCL4436933.1 HNH endonuclease [Clostridium botulinum]HCL4439763.1 HNH endonuclease [Clostridium botulinum]HCL4450481.1 HNH endonuclease [Clostridium botulinum]HCL4451983.1 HNH endonuclease [Clostridium botulinum]
MNNILENSISDLSVKQIDSAIVPKSNKVDSGTFSRLLDDDKVVASYKMYWLFGILEEVSLGNTEIEFNTIVARMIVAAWYPIMQYKLSFGVFDNLKRPVNYVALKYGFTSNCDESELLKFLCESEDKELKKMMRDLTCMVPYRLLSPFFTDKLKGKYKSSKNKIIEKLSLEGDTCFYKIIKEGKNRILINEYWAQYLNENYRVIKSWIYYKLVCFLQKRNPNVPAIAFKLEAPKNRDLSSATKIWKEIIVSKRAKDIYTGKDFIKENYEIYGGLSIDHFIPWSFVLHDEMWNLVPTFKNINSSKSDKLLKYNRYIYDFCDMQYMAVTYILKKGKRKDLESYIDALKIENFQEYLKYKPKEDFTKKLKQCISPLYQIAENQGFEVMDKLF